MVNLEKQIEVWIPHRISGFFQMMNPETTKKIKNPLKIGSRGGGPALEVYGKTKIYVNFNNTKTNNTKKINHNIYINEKNKTSLANTSETVINYMKPFILKELQGFCKLDIFHSFELPIGAGYGSSGAGALGIALGLNKLFKLGFSDFEAAKFAHIAEVENHTGLGTVGGQFIGGFTISMEPGYPFQMKKIPIPSYLRIIIASFGAISTKSILTEQNYKKLIYKIGKKYMKRMKTDFSIKNFMET